MKNHSSNTPTISVVTVVFNGFKTLRATIESVISQLTDEIEYLIIDGNSSDGTQEIIYSYANHLTYWISEPDAGIYDAMNKGTRQARGNYIYFLNAGDTFFGPNVLSQAAEHLHKNPAVLVGRVAVHGGKAPYFPLDINEKFRSDARKVFASHFCHQALFVRRQNLIDVGLFSLKYPRFADFHSTWRVMLHGSTLNVPNFVISNFVLDGVSSDSWKAVELFIEKEEMLSNLGHPTIGLLWKINCTRAYVYKWRKYLTRILSFKS